jgi:RNA polymerase sigma-70 factor, ECF subfamily
VTTAERDRLLGAFLAAAQAGDLATLESMLAEDAISLSDGGGNVNAARKPVAGRERVARFILGVLEKFQDGVTAMPVVANGEPAVLGVKDGHPSVVWSFDVGPEGVRLLQAVLNPQKLGGFAALALSHS